MARRALGSHQFTRVGWRMIAEYLIRRLASTARRDGDRARDARRWSEAAAAYRAYLKLRPDDGAIWTQYGHVLNQGLDHAAADEAYRTAAYHRRDDADILLCWGHSRLQAGDRDGARALYAQSHDLDGNDHAARALDALAEDAPMVEEAHAQEATPAPAPALVGSVEGIALRTVSGHVAASGPEPVEVVFAVGNRIVGIAKPGPAIDGAHPFRTELDIDGAARVDAYRRSDGAALAGSPFTIDLLPVAAPIPAWDVRAEIVKPLPPGDRREIAVLATYSSTGALKPHVGRHVRALREAGIAVVLVAMTDRMLDVPPAIVDDAAAVLVRHDRGFDFGAWAHALRLWPALYGAPILYLLNDSVAGPRTQAGLETLLERVRASDADLVGLTESHDHGWHPQSYFLALKERLLATAAVQLFWDDAQFHIEDGGAAWMHEIALTALARHHGRGIDILFPSTCPSDPIVDDARALLADGLPFIALAAFDEAQATAPEPAARNRPGFDRRQIAAASVADILAVEPPPDEAILVARHYPSAPDAADGLRIAFHGPWNRSGDDGDAARAMLALLHRGGWPLNVHASTAPDGDRALLAPAIVARDFVGAAAVAILALPETADATLDDGERRAAVLDVSLRIGWWTGAAAPANADVADVDELWVRSAAMAEALHGVLDVPVAAMPWSGDDASAARCHAALQNARARRRPLDARPPARLRPSLLAGVAMADAQAPGLAIIALEPDGSFGQRARAAFAQARHAAADDWFAFVPQGALLSPLLARHLRDAARARPDATLFYADDIAVETDEPIDQLRLKPEFDPTLLAAQDYIGAPLFVRASALARLDPPDPVLATAGIADLLFRAHALAMPIARITETLLSYPGERVRARDADYREMLRRQPHLAAFDIAPGRAPNSFALSRRFDGTEPAVTIVIPTMRAGPPGAPACIERLLDMLAATHWPMDRLTVVVGDDVAGAPDWADRVRPFSLRRIETVRAPGEAFNYAAKMNRLCREAGTEQIVFMNDDLVPRDGAWLRALLTFATQDGVGGVGARLLSEDGSVQHAGMIPHGAGAAHAWVHRNRVAGTYQDWALVHREWSMVTGALFATRRSVMAQAGGFDERFALEFNDSDLCLRLRTLGYRIVCTPQAELVHFEKVSRGEALPPGDDVARFRRRWRAWLQQDPAFHPGLRHDRLELTPVPPPAAWYL